MMHYYNEFDSHAAQWLRNLMNADLIPRGEVDERSIADVTADDIRGFASCHWFAGIAGWPLALRLAGWPDDRPVWTGSCPCFPAGTLVLTTNGYKPIEEVAVGDMVLTHRGRFRAVQRKGSEVADCVVVKGQGHHGLVCTPNHPFLVGEESWCDAANLAGRRWATVAAVPAVPIPELSPTATGCFFDKSVGKYRAKGEKGTKPIYIGVFDSLAEAAAARWQAVRDGRIDVRGADAADSRSLGFARFLGYWIGDGWVSGDSVMLCGSRDDCGLLNSLFAAAGLSGSAYLERTSSRIRCGSKHLSKWLREQFGEYAAGKRIPTWLYGMPEDYRVAFLEGYRLADGHEATQKGGGRIRCLTTASKWLAIGVRVMINQLGRSASVRMVRNNRLATIEGRVVSESPSYRVTEYDSARSFRLSGIHGWGLVRSVRPAGSHIVYNLAVEEDESYTADGIVVHNCQPFSAAGKRKGTADERHLWPEFYRLIKDCKPQTIFGEQVASSEVVGTQLEVDFIVAVQSGDYARANLIAKRLVASRGFHFDRRWIDGVHADLEAANYSMRFKILGAHSVLSPHIRQRLFWVANAGSPSPRDTEPGIGNGPNQQRREAANQPGGRGGNRGVGVAHPAGPQGRSVPDSGRGGERAVGTTGGDANHWSDYVLIPCRNEKARRIEPGLEPLVDGASFRLADGRTRDDCSRAKILKGIGNAIVPQVAVEFIKAFMQIRREWPCRASKCNTVNNPCFQ